MSVDMKTCDVQEKKKKSSIDVECAKKFCTLEQAKTPAHCSQKECDGLLKMWENFQKRKDTDK